MTRLLEERGRLREFDYDLSRKVLDHIEVTAGGQARSHLPYEDEGDGVG